MLRVRTQLVAEFTRRETFWLAWLKAPSSLICRVSRSPAPLSPPAIGGSNEQTYPHCFGARGRHRRSRRRLRPAGPQPTFKAEKCYGIAKAGKNDCASTGNNSCAGTTKARRPARLDLRARGLLRAHRQRQPDAEGLSRESAAAMRRRAQPLTRWAGVGLRLPHLAEVVAGAPTAAWLEVHPENFLANPHAREFLLETRAALPSPCTPLGYRSAASRESTASI